MNLSGKCIRLNLGGDKYISARGIVWEADRAYTPGGFGCVNMATTDVATTSDPISGTQDPVLFQSIRLGEEFRYRLDISPGRYSVGLYFAEIYWESSNAEHQDVYLNGRRVLKDFNIYDEVGHDAATVKRFATSAEDHVEVRFVGRSLPMHSGARACAIEVLRKEG